MERNVVDLAIIGGGVNGCGIARDAAGRGLSVYLAEMGDLGNATSSASTKLFHGGLRYLEYYEFRLVREALIERERLLSAMPHISWPLRFVLPHHKGLRPAWLLRLGLFIYDNLGGRKLLPATRSLDLRTNEIGEPLKDSYRLGFEYSDCWVDDARLVVLNARDAAAKGASINVGTKCVSARREEGLWRLELQHSEGGENSIIWARGLVNAGGPWAQQIITSTISLNSEARIRLVRGSHIVVKRLYQHDRAYIFQNADGRIIFSIPYEDDFTLIGTTDRDHEGAPKDAVCTDEEITYLCASASEYFKEPISPEQVVWTYSGVRPLYDDGASSASAATRDYVLKLEDEGGKAPLLNIFGGKITTYRKLAEAALAKLQPFYPAMGESWTADASMPGGGFPVRDAATLPDELQARYPFLGDAFAKRLARTYGRDAFEWLGGAERLEDLGRTFGFNLSEREVQWLLQEEWARSAEDILWRRTKLGLRLSAAEAEELDRWISSQKKSEDAQRQAS